MSFPYMNEHQNSIAFEAVSATVENNVQEFTHEAEVVEAHDTVNATIASSANDHWTTTLEDGGAVGTGSTLMSAASGNASGGASVARTALTTLDYVISEGTINAGDQMNLNAVLAVPTATDDLLHTLSYNWIQGLPAGVGVAA